MSRTALALTISDASALPSLPARARNDPTPHNLFLLQPGWAIDKARLDIYACHPSYGWQLCQLCNSSGSSRNSLRPNFAKTTVGGQTAYIRTTAAEDRKLHIIRHDTFVLRYLRDTGRLAESPFGQASLYMTYVPGTLDVDTSQIMFVAQGVADIARSTSPDVGLLPELFKPLLELASTNKAKTILETLVTPAELRKRGSISPAIPFQWPEHIPLHGAVLPGHISPILLASLAEEALARWPEPVPPHIQEQWVSIIQARQAALTAKPPRQQAARVFNFD